MRVRYHRICAEQWGRRWITVDTSRVALALARARNHGAPAIHTTCSPDSRDGQIKEAEVTRTTPSSQPVRGSIRHGFVYERVPPHHAHIYHQQRGDRRDSGAVAGEARAAASIAERRAEGKVAGVGNSTRSGGQVAGHHEEGARRLVARAPRGAASRSMLSIAAKAEFEHLYDKPYDDKKKRLASPDHSRSRAFRRTVSWASMRTTN